jgi:hypothetical protein
MTEHGRPSADEPPVGGPPSSVPEETAPATAEPAPADDVERPRRRIVVPPFISTRTARMASLVGILVVAASVALGVVAFAATTFYEQYGAVRNGPNADAWAGLAPRFVGQAACASCHETQAAMQDSSVHVDVSCESCHGPGAAHAVSDDAAREIALSEPTGGICITCHAVAAGRPASFPQVDLVAHYSGGECLRCHDPHSIIAFRPPDVSHPLADLPECVTCHAPDGLKKVASGHEIVRDEICLSCHARGVDESPEPSP